MGNTGHARRVAGRVGIALGNQFVIDENVIRDDVAQQTAIAVGFRDIFDHRHGLAVDQFAALGSGFGPEVFNLTRVFGRVRADVAHGIGQPILVEQHLDGVAVDHVNHFSNLRQAVRDAGGPGDRDERPDDGGRRGQAIGRSWMRSKGGLQRRAGSRLGLLADRQGGLNNIGGDPIVMFGRRCRRSKDACEHSYREDCPHTKLPGRQQRSGIRVVVWCAFGLTYFPTFL